MQIIVKCPSSSCGKGMLVKCGSDYSSEVITTETKKCTGCDQMVVVSIKVVAKLQKPAEGKA
jgi:hypothetical protein